MRWTEWLYGAAIPQVGTRGSRLPAYDSLAIQDTCALSLPQQRKSEIQEAHCPPCWKSTQTSIHILWKGVSPTGLVPLTTQETDKCARVFHLLKTASDTSTDCGTFNWILYMLLKDISYIIVLPAFLILCQSWLPVLLYFEKRNSMSHISGSPSISRKCLSYKWFINIQSINSHWVSIMGTILNIRIYYRISEYLEHQNILQKYTKCLHTQFIIN